MVIKRDVPFGPVSKESIHPRVAYFVSDGDERDAGPQFPSQIDREQSLEDLTEKRRVLISVNPKAGARDQATLANELAKCLDAKGFSAEISSDIEWISGTAAELSARGELRAVVAAGGDGTVGLIANRVPAEAPIAVLPLGTENLLSKYLDLTAAPEQLAEVISTGKTIHLDAGEANGELFLLMAGCGFDAEVVRRLHGGRTGHINHFSYAKPILDSMRSYDYPELRVYCDDATEPSVTAKWVFIVNVPKYAGGLQFVPDASGSDGLLDVCTFKQGSIVAGLWYLTGVFMGQHQNLNDCTTLQASRFRIETDGDVPYQLDGDPGGALPLEVRVIPQRLQLWVASNWKESNPSDDLQTATRPHE